MTMSSSADANERFLSSVRRPPLKIVAHSHTKSNGEGAQQNRNRNRKCTTQVSCKPPNPQWPLHL